VAIGLHVDRYEAGSLELSAPLAPNVNHKDTAFAGSLTAVATLTGWGLLWLLLEEQGLAGKIVIQDCSVRYLRPVTWDFRAHCQLPEPATVERFLHVFRRRGVARIELRAEIVQEREVAVELVGRYVVHRP
jgi:thioesterase domain-containing protein